MFPSWHSQEHSTTHNPQDGGQVFQITHPFHPLHGRQFVLADRRLTWGEDRVYYHDEKGALKRLPAEWTSVSTPSVFEQIAAGRSHFRLADLLELVALIARQREVQPERPAKRANRVSGK